VGGWWSSDVSNLVTTPKRWSSTNAPTNVVRCDNPASLSSRRRWLMAAGDRIDAVLSTAVAWLTRPVMNRGSSDGSVSGTAVLALLTASSMPPTHREPVAPNAERSARNLRWSPQNFGAPMLRPCAASSGHGQGLKGRWPEPTAPALRRMPSAIVHDLDAFAHRSIVQARKSPFHARIPPPAFGSRHPRRCACSFAGGFETLVRSVLEAGCSSTSAQVARSAGRRCRLDPAFCLKCLREGRLRFVRSARCGFRTYLRTCLDDSPRTAQGGVASQRAAATTMSLGLCDGLLRGEHELRHQAAAARRLRRLTFIANGAWIVRHRPTRLSPRPHRSRPSRNDSRFSNLRSLLRLKSIDRPMRLWRCDMASRQLT